MLNRWTVEMIIFFFNETATTEIYTLSLHDALPVLHVRGGGYSKRVVQPPMECLVRPVVVATDDVRDPEVDVVYDARRSEEHTSELQSRQYLVCRLLLEKKKHCSPPTIQ